MSTGSLGLWVFGAMVGIPVAVVGVIILTASVFQRRRDRLIATTGRRAIGHVLAVGSDIDDLGDGTYWIRVQYDNDGEPVTAQVAVNPRDHQRYRVSQRIGLTYARGRPQVVRPDPPECALRQAS